MGCVAKAVGSIKNLRKEGWGEIKLLIKIYILLYPEDPDLKYLLNK